MQRISYVFDWWIWIFWCKSMNFILLIFVLKLNFYYEFKSTSSTYDNIGLMSIDDEKGRQRSWIIKSEWDMKIILVDSELVQTITICRLFWHIPNCHKWIRSITSTHSIKFPGTRPANSLKFTHWSHKDIFEHYYMTHGKYVRKTEWCSPMKSTKS